MILQSLRDQESNMVILSVSGIVVPAIQHH